MKPKPIHGKISAARKIDTHAERFERWLLTDRTGMGQPRNGTNAQQITIYCNLEDAARAPFDTDAKVSVLSSLFMPSNPNKSLLVMEALLEIAVDGSEHAREAFENAAERWLTDPLVMHLNEKLWAKGVILAVRASSELDSPQLRRAIGKAAQNEPKINFWKEAVKQDCDVS
jgi:hypothetical protein